MNEKVGADHIKLWKKKMMKKKKKKKKRKAIQVIEKIQANMKIGQDRQKGCANRRQKELEFTIGDWVFLKVTPIIGILWLGKNWKLWPRYIGPFKIGK